MKRALLDGSFLLLTGLVSLILLASIFYSCRQRGPAHETTAAATPTASPQLVTATTVPSAPEAAPLVRR